MNSGLLIIDVQKGFDALWWGARNNPTAEVNIASILAHFRERKGYIYHVKHNSLNPKSPLYPGKKGNAIKQIVAPIEGEPIFEKTVNSAFLGTKLEERLREDQRDTLVIVGLTTDQCVSTTARMAANLGFKVYVVADATATFNKVGYTGKLRSAKYMHESALDSLSDEFATIITTDVASS